LLSIVERGISTVERECIVYAKVRVN